MKKNKTSVSQKTSYTEIGEYWGDHDLTELWNKTRKADFNVQIESEVTYYAVEKELSEQVQDIAKKRGVSSDTLVNLWIQQMLQSQKKVAKNL